MHVITATFHIEKIENGYVIKHVQANRAQYVHYEFEVARAIERLMHEEAELSLAGEKNLSGEMCDPFPRATVTVCGGGGFAGGTYEATGSIMQQDA